LLLAIPDKTNASQQQSHLGLHSKIRGFPTLVILQWIFYGCLVFLWFKDNVFALKKIRVSYLWALIPLIGIVGLRFFLSVKKKKLTLRPQSHKTTLLLVGLLLLTAAVRLPFLAYGWGLMNSDQAVTALMAKHITEGQVPPINYYGQQYVGSLGSHIDALAFGVFGYSIQTAEAVSLVIYLAFVLIQFLFFKDIFSAAWAAVLSVFYSLPLWHLIVISLDTSNPFALVLFLQAAVLYTAYAIAYLNKDRLWPLLGFLMGLSFWTHQITAAAILGGLLIVVFKTRFDVKRYGQLLFYGLAGGFPLLLNEIFNRFQILRFLLREGETSGQGGKLKTTLDMVRSLLFYENRPGRSVFLLFLLAGIGTFAYLAFRRKEYSRGRVFLLFLVVFSGMYAISGFSGRLLPRYLFPLYLCLPVFLMAPFLWFKPKLRYVLPLVLLAGLLALDSGRAYSAYFRSVQSRHRLFEETVAAMAGTGNRFWQGEYWAAYLLTALSKEQNIVDAYSSNRYLPYRLMYYNPAHKDNYVFYGNPDQAGNLERLLAGLGVSFDKSVVGECVLLYNIDGSVFPDVLDEKPPSRIPDLAVEDIQNQAGYLQITFRNGDRQEASSFRLNAEIPGWSARTKVFPGTSDLITIRIPYPRRPSFTVRYYLDYQSLKIPSSVREFPYSFSGRGPEESPETFVYLRGISPVVHFSGKDLRYCEREGVFEVNAPPAKKARLRIILNSPFIFSDPSWHGAYTQDLKIRFDDELVADKKLQGGINVIELDLAASRQRPVRVSLSFRYQSFFEPISLRTFSATLEGLDIIEEPGLKNRE
jgi:hypothetical protein